MSCLENQLEPVACSYSMGPAHFYSSSRSFYQRAVESNRAKFHAPRGLLVRSAFWWAGRGGTRGGGGQLVLVVPERPFPSTVSDFSAPFTHYKLSFGELCSSHTRRLLILHVLFLTQFHFHYSLATVTLCPMSRRFQNNGCN